MRWLKKRGTVWHYRFNFGGIDYSGSTGSPDLKTAQKVLAYAQQQAILLRINQGDPPTLGTVIQTWLETRGRSVSPGHRTAAEQARNALGKLVKLPLDRLTTATVQGWVSDHLESHSPATVNNVLRYLRLWVRSEMGQTLRVFPYEAKPIKVQQRQRPVVEAPEDFLDRACAKARNPQIRCALALAMMTGLRESELLQARWEWIRDGVLTVGGNTKSRKIRAIPLPDAARVVLLQMLAAIEHGPARFPDLGLIFPGKKGKAHKKGWLRKPLERGGGIGIHRLRATFVTRLLRAKVNPKDVQEMAGHQHISTTMVYSEGSLDEKRKAQESLWA